MSVDLCAEQVARSDPWRFATAMTAPLPQRGDLMVLYAFNLEVARAPWVTSEPMLAEMRLQWWRDAIAEIYDGTAPRRHEVVTPLAELIARKNLPRESFDKLIDARRYEIYPETERTFQDARRFLWDTSSEVMALASRALGANRKQANSAHCAGLGQGAAQLILAAPELEAAGRPPFSRTDPSVRSAIAEVGLKGLKIGRMRKIPRAIAPALRPAIGAEPILRLVIANPQMQPQPRTAAQRSVGLSWAVIRDGW